MFKNDWGIIRVIIFNCNRMNKKKLTKIIVSVVGSVILAVIIILIGLGYKSLELNERGLNYDMVTGSYSSELYFPGISYIGVNSQFLKVNIGQQAINILNVKCLTSDFIVVTLSVQVAYQILNQDVGNLTQYLILFGFEPQEILTPIMRNEIHSTMAGYNLTALSSFSSTQFESEVKARITETLAPMTAMNITVRLQTITTNYQNQQSSGRIAELKQQIQKYQQEIGNINDSLAGDYTYLVQTLIAQANTTLQTLLTTQSSRLTMTKSWINSTVSTDKFRNYIKSTNQSFYQFAIAPTFVTNGTFT